MKTVRAGESLCEQVFSFSAATMSFSCVVAPDPRRLRASKGARGKSFATGIRLSVRKREACCFRFAGPSRRSDLEHAKGLQTTTILDARPVQVLRHRSRCSSR